MKTILVVFALCVVGALGVLTDEQKAKLKAHKEACVTETGVDAAVVENAKEGKFAEDDEKLKCFAACMLRKIGLMNDDGTLNVELAKSKISPGAHKDEAEAAIERCKTVSGSTTCEKGGNFLKCIMTSKGFVLL